MPGRAWNRISGNFSCQSWDALLKGVIFIVLLEAQALVEHWSEHTTLNSRTLLLATAHLLRKHVTHVNQALSIKLDHLNNAA